MPDQRMSMNLLYVLMFTTFSSPFILSPIWLFFYELSFNRLSLILMDKLITSLLLYTSMLLLKYEVLKVGHFIMFKLGICPLTQLMQNMTYL